MKKLHDFAVMVNIMSGVITLLLAWNMKGLVDGICCMISVTMFLYSYVVMIEKEDERKKSCDSTKKQPIKKKLLQEGEAE